MSKSKSLKINSQHVFSVGNGWAVKSEKSKSFFLITDRLNEAISVARDLAKKAGSELIIYAKNGSIRLTESYSDQSVKKTPAKK